jgi:small subunit ribosomal protein S3
MGEKESALVARFIATRLEKRIVFRRVIRKVEEILGRRKVKGFKLQLSGRLNGAEIARVAWTREGRVPLQTLGADISYATYRAHTIYGIIGIKVWIFLGEI